MVATVKMAVTGGTGFVGSRLVDAAIAAGHFVKALTRRPQKPRPSLDWVTGSLSDRMAIEQLVGDADSIIHVAGVINALDTAGFEAGNVAGTLATLAAATAGGVRRFVYISSLAARAPELSLYGASKAKAERLVERSGLDWVIVRPPAVYGPGDRETLELFRMAKRGVVLLPPKGRLSLIHVDDLARLLLALAEPNTMSGQIVEPDDGRAGGWSHKELAQALGTALGRRGISVSVPAGLLKLGARADRLLRGDKAKLTPDRATYFSHPDWIVDPALAAPRTLWHPQIATQNGLAATASWYREQGWL